MWGAQKRSKTRLKNTPCKNAFKKHPLQNRTNVQIKGGGRGGSKAFWTMFKKTALFWKGGIPYFKGRGHHGCESLCQQQHLWYQGCRKHHNQNRRLQLYISSSSSSHDARDSTLSTVINNIEEIFTQTLQNQKRIITILESLGVDFIQVLSKYKRASIVVQNCLMYFLFATISRDDICLSFAS